MFDPGSVSTAAKEQVAQRVAIRRVTDWTKEQLEQLFGVDSADQEKLQIAVTEVQCNLPDCVPIETLVIVIPLAEGMWNGQQKWADKIMLPVQQVTAADVAALCSNLPLDWKQRAFEWQVEKLTERYTAAAPHTNSVIRNEADVAVLRSIFSSALRRKADELDVTNSESSNIDVEALQKGTGVETSPPAASTQVTMVKMQPISSSTTVNMVPNTSGSQNAATPTAQGSSSTTVDDDKYAAAREARKRAAVNAMAAQQASFEQATIRPRHGKEGTRPRGCPCCDPDNLDNIVDNLMFMQYPQN